MQMHTSTISCIVASFLIVVSLTCGVSASYEALFAFGDSYADTGNHKMHDPTTPFSPWRVPYGKTWPGSPSGRYSDGRLFTDYYAYSLNVTSPIPYRVVNETVNSSSDAANVLQSLGGGGINFAFGGSGVFPTFGPQYPNVSTQIDELKELIAKGVVSSNLVNSSVVLLVVATNDYGAFIQSHPTIEISMFIPKVVAQIVASVQELYDLGFRTIAVTNLEPMGCLPNTTQSNNYTACDETINVAVSIAHNTLLASDISILQLKILKAKIILLDFYNAFEAAWKGKHFPLRPCCEGVDGASFCGDTNTNGGLLYTLCSSPKKALFWDSFHPTNAGWKAISKALLSKR